MKTNVRYHNIILRKAGVILFISALEMFTLLGQDQVTFALLTDLHVDPFSSSDSALNRIADEINTSGIDFTIVSGDLTNTGSDAELEAVKHALARLKKPYYVLPGNHETNWSESAGLAFDRLWGDDRFCFTFGRYRFVGFNTGPFMRMGDGLVKQEDLRWLKRIIGKDKPEDEVLISVSHYPLSDGLGNWNEVTDILKSADCRLSFCGHGHKLSLYNFDDIPGIMGRPLLFANSKIPGYNIVRIRGDSVQVYNKEYGRKEGVPAFRLSLVNHDFLNGIPVSPKPDYSVNSEFPEVRFSVLYTDTASVFTGPCIVNDTMLVYCNSAGYVKGISLNSNRVLWQTETTGPVYSTPVFCLGNLVMGSVDGNILGMNAADGKILWQVQTGGPVLAEGISEKDCVYIGGHHSFYKINASSGMIVWHFDGVSDLIQGSPAM